jgi:hypothetical protein
MKFYLTLMRRDGKRLPPDQISQPPRLANLKLSSKQGFRHLEAVCCFGGTTLCEMWEPVLGQIGAEDFMLHGFERMGEAGLVQEWQLKPHSVRTEV